MTFQEAMKEALLCQKTMIRQKCWADGVVIDISNNSFDFCHVAAGPIKGGPKPKDFLENDWIVVKDYGVDIGYKR